MIAHRQALVGRRVTLQNRVRAILLGQGLVAPVGARTWASAGLAKFRTLARPLAERLPAELWRGRLDRSLVEYAQVLGATPTPRAAAVHPRSVAAPNPCTDEPGC